MGGIVEKQIQKTLRLYFHCRRAGIDAALVRAHFSFAGAPAIENKIEQYRGRKTHPKSRNTEKTPRSRELFRKVRANFCLLPCDTSQEPNGNCSEKLVQMNFFYFGWIFVDFPPLTINSKH